MTAKSLTAYI